LADFGFCKQLAKYNNDIEKSVILGTPGYISPECLNQNYTYKYIYLYDFSNFLAINVIFGLSESHYFIWFLVNFHFGLIFWVFPNQLN